LSIDKIQRLFLRKGAITEKGCNKRLKIISHIPWDPRTFLDKEYIAWLHALETSHFYFYKINDMGNTKVFKFHWEQNLGLLTQEEGVFSLPNSRLHLARVILWNVATRSFQECIPFDIPDKPSLVWMMEREIVHRLDWDLKDWVWIKTNKMREALFFGYTTRQGVI